MLNKSVASALGLVWTLVLACPASAGSMFEATIMGKPDIHMRDGNVSSCGMRILALEKVEPTDAFINVIDSSFYVTLNSGLVKATHSRPTPKDIANNRLISANLPIKSFWFKTPGHTATQPTAGLMTSETKNALFYATSLDSAFALLSAVASGETIQIGFQKDGSSVSTILYGKVQISAADFSQLKVCVEELGAQAGGQPK